MIDLPISGRQVRWRAVNGHDDAALAEGAPGLAGAVDYLSRVAVAADGDPVAAAALPVGDVDVLVVGLRRQVLGDAFVAEGSCPRCAADVDIHFSLSELVRHQRPRPSRSVTVASEPGWWQLRDDDVTFRLPTAADVLTAAGRPDARAEIERRCLRGTVDARVRRRVDRAMSALGPTLESEVAGSCPECGGDVLLEVDGRELCLVELRFLAGSVFDDVHLIAATYRWSEGEILDLTSARRTRYADLIGGRTSSSELWPEGAGVA